MPSAPATAGDLPTGRAGQEERQDNGQPECLAPFRLTAHVKVPDPRGCLRCLSAHLREDAVDVRDDDGGFTVIMPRLRGSARCDADTIVFDLTAIDLESLYFAKAWLQIHLSEGAGTAKPEIDWSGSCSSLSVPPSFSILTVVSVTDITPRMRRIRCRATDIVRFQTLDTLHLQLMVNFDAFFAQRAEEPVSTPPRKPDLEPIWRRYTVRAVDAYRNLLDIDVFLHAGTGPGAEWARTVRTGDRIGAAGPTGGGLAAADWYLFAGDETALPAIARMLEALPDTAVATALMLVRDKAECQTITSTANVRIEWLFRDDSDDGECLLRSAIQRIAFPRTDTRKMVWVGCEALTAKVIRRDLRERQQCTKQEHLVVSYWRKPH